MDDVLSFNPISSIGDVSLALLLYSHEIVMDDLSVELVDPDPEVRHAAARWLVCAKPLYEAGAIHFRPVSSSGRHPSNRFRQSERFDRVIEQLNDRELVETLGYEQLLKRRYGYEELASLDRGPLYWRLTIGFLNSVASSLAHAVRWPNSTNRLLRSRAERVIMNLYLARASKLLDRREVTLSRLAIMTVPRLNIDSAALAKVRSSEEVFAEFRAHLARALDRVDLDENSDPDSVIKARQILIDEMSPLTVRIENACKQSPFLAAAKSGASGFGVSALAAGVGFLAGGSLVSSLASAGAAKGVEVAAKFIKARSEQAKGAAVRDLVVSFGHSSL